MRACLRLYRRLPYVSAIAVCFIGLYCTAAYITNLFAFKMCAGGSMADGALFFFFLYDDAVEIHVAVTVR